MEKKKKKKRERGRVAGDDEAEVGGGYEGHCSPLFYPNPKFTPRDYLEFEG